MFPSTVFWLTPSFWKDPYIAHNNQYHRSSRFKESVTVGDAMNSEPFYNNFSGLIDSLTLEARIGLLENNQKRGTLDSLNKAGNEQYVPHLRFKWSTSKVTNEVQNQKFTSLNSTLLPLAPVLYKSPGAFKSGQVAFYYLLILEKHFVKLNWLWLVICKSS